MAETKVKIGNTDAVSRAAGALVTGHLGIAFVVLRLTHVIRWPWVWVLAPFWIPLALQIVIFVLALLIVVRRDRKRRVW